MRRGEVWFVQFDPTVEHEQAGVRPALILSIDSFNLGPSQLVAVLPITSTQRAYIPSRVEVHPPEGGLRTKSYIICEQVRVISTQRVRQRSGVVEQRTIEHVEQIVRDLLGL